MNDCILFFNLNLILTYCVPYSTNLGFYFANSPSKLFCQTKRKTIKKNPNFKTVF